MTSSFSDVMQHITSPLALHTTLLSQVWRIILVFSESDSSLGETPKTSTFPHIKSPKRRWCAVNVCQRVPAGVRAATRASLHLNDIHLYPPGPHPVLGSRPQLRKPEEKHSPHRSIQTESSLHSHLTHLSHRKRLFKCSDASLRSV